MLLIGSAQICKLGATTGSRDKRMLALRTERCMRAMYACPLRTQSINKAVMARKEREQTMLGSYPERRVGEACWADDIPLVS